MAYQIPRGTQDLLPEKSYQWQALERTLREFCYLYNYDEIRTPVFEHTNVFKRENDSSDMVNKEMYTFQLENSKTSLTIRPEGTAGVVRSFVENKMYANPDLPVKLYYMGPMARHDTLGDDASRAAYRQALQTYFEPYVDTLCSDCKRRYAQNPLRILDCKVDHDKECMKNVPKMKDYLNDESREYFETVCHLLDELEIPYAVDDQLVRGLDYYTHTVFEIVSMNQEMGAQSTVLAGGRYDHLIPYFGGPEQMSGIGWALGMERLLIALEAEGITLEEKPGLDAYLMCLDESARMYAFKILTQLRAYGYRCDMDMLQRSFKAQFKAVDRSHAKFALIIGEDEHKNHLITIKNIEKKTQESISQDDLIEYLDHYFVDEDHH